MEIVQDLQFPLQQSFCRSPPSPTHSHCLAPAGCDQGALHTQLALVDASELAQDNRLLLGVDVGVRTADLATALGTEQRLLEEEFDIVGEHILLEASQQGTC